MKKISGFILLALLGATLNGQVRQPHSLYFMETIPQILQMNPALQPRANGYLMLPNVNADIHSDIALKDILQKQGNKWHTPIEKQYDYAKLRRAIGKNATMFNHDWNVDLIGFGFRAGNGYFSLGLSEHFIVNTALPSDMFKITENGFPSGTTLDFSPMLNSQAIAYMQLRFGYSGKVNDKLSIGMNVKLLSGQAAVASKIDKFTIHTSEQMWEIDAKGNIYSSAPINVNTDAEGKIDNIEDRIYDNYKTKDFISDYVTSLNNPGIALDFGVAYELNERITISASLNNLGFISWENDLNSISFNGKYPFKGVYYDVTGDDDFGDLLSNLGDSIINSIGYTVKRDKFKTTLTPVFHAGVSYQLSKAVSAGFLSRTAFWQNGVRQSFNTSLYLQPYSFMAMNVGVNYQVKGSVHLGGGFMFLLGPLQFYALVDNVPITYSTYRIINNENPDRDEFSFPQNLKTVTGRVGINFVFGRHGYVNKPMLDARRSSWN